jgi:hypothetical protein
MAQGMRLGAFVDAMTAENVVRGTGTRMCWARREKQEVFPAGPRDGFTTAQTIHTRPGPFHDVGLQSRCILRSSDCAMASRPRSSR